MKVGDMVREKYIDHHFKDEGGALGVVVEIDPLRAGYRGQRWREPTVEIVVLLSSGQRTFEDPKRWEVISESPL